MHCNSALDFMCYRPLIVNIEGKRIYAMESIIDVINKRLLNIDKIGFGRHTFTITLGNEFFNAKVGLLHDTHCHSCFEIHYVAKGRILMKIGQERLEINEGGFVIIKPHAYHTTFIDSEINNTLRCSFTFSYSLRKRKKNEDVFARQDAAIKNIIGMKSFLYGKSEKIYESLLNIHDEIESDSIFSRKNIQASFTRIFIEIFRSTQKNLHKQTPAKKTLYEKRNYIIDSYFTENYMNSEAGIKELSEITCISIRQLERVMLKIYGCSFREKLTSIRIEQAKHLLLSTQISVEKISQQTGFFNLTYFYRVFKKKTGLTPGKFRINSIDP